MVELQRFSEEQQLSAMDEEQQLSALDDAYLEEMTDRILRLRMLHLGMDNTPDPWQWMKTLAEKA